MRVLIIGAGAMGFLLGSIITRDKGHVTYLTRTSFQADILNKSGIIVESKAGQPIAQEVQAFPFTEQGTFATYGVYSKQHFDSFDCVIVTIKQHHLDLVLPWIDQHIGKKLPLLFLMNGLGHQEKIKNNLEHKHTYYGMTQMGAMKTTENTIQEKGKGITKIGRIPESQRDTQAEITSQQDHHPGIISLINTFRNQHFEIDWSGTIEIDMWKKCIVNACINPLTALFRVENGALVKNHRLHHLMYKLYQEMTELITVLKPKQKDAILLKHNLWLEIEQICTKTADNHSSMLQDIKHNRQTEIDAITGYLLTQAKLCGILMPYHQFLFESIHAIEQGMEMKS